jgi:hypothetical protein
MSSTSCSMGMTSSGTGRRLDVFSEKWLVKLKPVEL